jgi:hypothetical protein
VIRCITRENTVDGRKCGFEQVEESAMPVMQPPTRPIEVSDPNNVPETFVNGPFNIVKAGGMVHLTFTAARPNPNDLFKGSATPGFQATITCRLVMPLEMAEQLSRTLAGTVSKGTQPNDARPEIIKLTDPPEKGKSPGLRRQGPAARRGEGP